MQKIFIVEDELEIVKIITKVLEQWNFEVQSVQDFQNVATEVLESNSDIVLMDITLPSYNGFHWTQEIRKSSTVPIIFISSASEQLNMVMAMNMGADDFISKPFDLQVLVAKIQALLRRTYVFDEEHKKENDNQFLNFLLDPLEDKISNGEEEIFLSKTETKIMSILFQNSGEVVTKEEILKKLWNGGDFVDPNTLSVNLTRLRKKTLEIGLSQYIHTIRGEGYLLGEE